VQDAFVAGGRLFVIKNGELWHEKLGGGDVVGPEKRRYLDWAVRLPTPQTLNPNEHSISFH
jgi:hypothetical protein